MIDFPFIQPAMIFSNRENKWEEAKMLPVIRREERLRKKER